MRMKTKIIIIVLMVLMTIGIVVAGGFTPKEISGFTAEELAKIEKMGYNPIKTGDTNCNSEMLCRTTIVNPNPKMKPVGLYFYTTALDEESIQTARNEALTKWIRERIPADAKPSAGTAKGDDITLK